MIQIILPIHEAGGVYDFACKLKSAIGQHAVRLVHLSKENVGEWKVDPDDTVVLQLSGYGFDKRGAPLWLLREMEKRRKHIKSLGIYFHELYAFGPPWSSAFWLSPLQRHIARKLAELSDFWMTNREGSAQWLRRFADDKPHAVLPVFSNVGEPTAPAQPRLPRIVVFGSPGLRQKTYLASGDKLFAWAKQASLEVHDIGAPIEDMRVADALRANGVILHGHLEERQVGQLMEDAMFGLVAYPVEYAAKSGVYAAYCAHGVCPLLISNDYVQADGLVAGHHYLPGIPDDEKALQDPSIRQAAWEWYQSHRVGRHAVVIKRFVN
jgi:hypothetical protein